MAVAAGNNQESLAKEIDMSKLTALFQSRRFWGAIVAAMLNIVGPTIGLSEDQTLSITALVVAWIVGDSLTKTE